MLICSEAGREGENWREDMENIINELMNLGLIELNM